MTTVFIGDTGTEIALDCGVNISTATVRNIIAKKPDGSKVTWVASADGTNGIKYASLTADFDQAGTWAVQAYIEMPGWKGYGNASQLYVKAPL